MPKLNKGDIVVALEDIIIPGIKTTYFIYKEKKYELKESLDSKTWGENAWYIENVENILISRKERRKGKYDNKCGWFKESELFQKFDCIKITRKRKLDKIQIIANNDK